jgi:hypothetical protein
MRRIISALLFSISSTLALAQATASPCNWPKARRTVTSWPRATRCGASPPASSRIPTAGPNCGSSTPTRSRTRAASTPGQVITLDKSGRPAAAQAEHHQCASAASTSNRMVKEFRSSSRRSSNPSSANRACWKPAASTTHRASSPSKAIASCPVPATPIYTTEVKEQHKLWQIFRPGKALVDPDTGDTLGVEAVYLGNARQTGRRAGQFPDRHLAHGNPA